MLDQGYAILEACRSLDIGETALRRWVQQLELERGGGTPVSKALTTEQRRIHGVGSPGAPVGAGHAPASFE